jgi:hypothetical protein
MKKGLTMGINTVVAMTLALLIIAIIFFLLTTSTKETRDVFDCPEGQCVDKSTGCGNQPERPGICYVGDPKTRDDNKVCCSKI